MAVELLDLREGSMPGDVLAAVCGLYLFFVFLKQGFKRDSELRSFWLVLALLVLPLIAAVHFVGQWDFSPEADWNKPDKFWCVPIPPSQPGGQPSSFNVIFGGLVLAILYAAATVLVGLFSWYYRVKRQAPMLAIHKVLVKLAIVLVGLGVFLQGQGISLTPLWVGMGAASIIVGIALQEPLANLFTGIALDLEGVFKRNEWIRVGGERGVVGKVVEKNWRTTKLVTMDDELVVIPNRTLGSETILNYHQPTACHAHKLFVGTSYNDPPVKVKEVLRAILLSEPRILKDPPPRVRTIKYNDFSIDYELKFWIANYGDHNEIKSAVMTQVWYAFKSHGIEIPFPIRTIHTKPPEHIAEEDVVRDRRFGDIIAFLESLGFLNAHLAFKDFEFLAHNCFQRPYRPAEHIIFRGELGDALYIVREKWCEAILADGQRRRIESGQYFGEMGLLSLKPRTADVVAGEEGSNVIRVDRECMESLFKRYPRLRDEIVRVRDMRLEDAGARKEVPEAARRPLWLRLLRSLLDFCIPW